MVGGEGAVQTHLFANITQAKSIVYGKLTKAEARKTHSDRSASITSTRAARAAGSIDAATAAAINTSAAATTGSAPGIFTSCTQLPATRANAYPDAPPATMPNTATTAPSAINRVRS